MDKLYVLPFDHRGSFAKMFGFEHGNLTESQSAALKDYKHLIYEGFLAALKLGISKKDGAILVDEEFGAKIHEEARAAGITRILTVEKSGQDEFDFEYGDKFREHIENIKPDYVKVLVRYNPDGDKESNKRQIERLKIMSDFCAESRSISSGQAGYKFMFELLAVPTGEQLAEVGGQEEFEKSLQWKVMRKSIEELRRGGVDPDIWKIEGLEDGEQLKYVVEETQKNTKKVVSVIVLGRGESGEKVKKWLSVAAKNPAVIGLAVGHTVFKQPRLDYAEKKISREDAANEIAKNYKKFVDIFERKKNSNS